MSMPWKCFCFFALVQHVQPLCLQWSLAQLFPEARVGGISQWSVFLSLMSMVNLHLQHNVVGDKGISEIKSKQQNPCSNCLHRPVMSWNNACSTCMHKPVSCMHQPLMSQADWHALTAWDLKFQVCLGYTFTPATLSLAYCSDFADYKVKFEFLRKATIGNNKKARSKWLYQ